MAILTEALLSVLVVVLSAIPLNLAVKMLGGHSSLLKVIGVNFLIAVCGVFLTTSLDGSKGLISFLVLIVLYKVMFDLSWLKALLAWILQFIIAVILILIVGALGFGLAFL